jgi:hypothetical protein
MPLEKPVFVQNRAGLQRKVRAPQGTVPGNARGVNDGAVVVPYRECKERIPPEGRLRRPEGKGEMVG